MGEITSSLPIVGIRRRVRSVLRTFEDLTGLTVVASLAPARGEAGMPRLAPPVHPRCAATVRGDRDEPPCKEQWFAHLRSGRHSAKIQTHVCPLGLQCACVPVHLDGQLVGIAKLVSGGEMSRRHFADAARLLDLVVSGVSQESVVTRSSEEVNEPTAWREQGGRRAGSSGGVTGDERGVVERHDQCGLVEAALSYLDRHYQAADLCLLSVARSLACNPRYLTTRFTRVVGERMHAYLVGRRVAHASRLLIETSMPVKEVAFASGFRDSTALARAFRRRVGTSPGEYRRVFGSAASR